MNSNLRRLFENALKVSLASPLIFSCGGGGIDTGSFQAVECSTNGFPAVTKLMPTNGADYVDIRSVFMDFSDGGTSSTVLSSSGTRCSGATDMPSCIAAYDALNLNPGWPAYCGGFCARENYAVTSTKGNEAQVAASIDALKSFLGTIDTAQEAVLIAMARPMSLSCTDKSRGAVKQTAHGFEVLGITGTGCGQSDNVVQHVLAVNSNGDVAETSSVILQPGMPGCVSGRRPEGLQAVFSCPTGDNALARYFACTAHLEAASVPAFLILRDELRAHGAPVGLQLAAHLSAGDEVRHARAVSRLARRFGGTPVRPRVTPHAVRSIAGLARENAVEGCVRETWGALVAHRQALAAKDTHVAAQMQTIAQDETRHAALSWQIDAWAQRRLSRVERRELGEARREAVRTLRAEVAREIAPQLVEQAGLPEADEAVTLLDSLEQTLWS